MAAVDRTTTTTKAVVSLAVWVMAQLALSGCVTVEPPPSGPPPRGGRPEPTADARIVQGPAREVLRAAPDEPVDPPPPDSAAGGTAPLPPPPPPAPVPAPAAERVRPPTAAGVRGAPRTLPRPAPRPRRVPAPPRVVLPPDVCRLGEAHGGWRRESAQSRACRQVYGRLTGR
ncbi:hypothetical protein BB341_24995 [Streptomyces clavuligerus]|nr:hypothetical protein BB341_24995 [Streptomyces clavuligerus]